jgi:hypothetical protein
MQTDTTPQLAPGQVARLVVLGIVLWFTGAMLLRWLIPQGAFEGSARALSYALLIPGTAPFIWLIARVARLGRQQVPAGVALTTGAAVLCDGVALAWYPSLYAAESAGAHLAGAAILWGAGVAIGLGFVMADRIAATP